MQQSSEAYILSKETLHVTLVITQSGHKAIMEWYHYLALCLTTYPFKAYTDHSQE